MNRTRIHAAFAAAFGLLAGTVASSGQQAGHAELQRLVMELREKNQLLQRSLAEANRNEKQASEQLGKVRQRLEALGRDLLDGGDERLIQAASDIQILNERIERLEVSAAGFSEAVAAYVRQTVSSDPEARLRVESAMRELDEVLGLRQKPAPTAQNSGTASRARVASIDAESGLLVFNIGEKQGTRIGSLYRLFRGDQAYGTAIVADVRPSISGAFVESLENGYGPVRLGDTAILETE